jgi:predicted DNA-binding protein YlxM (UPF0122 family)
MDDRISYNITLLEDYINSGDTLKKIGERHGVSSSAVRERMQKGIKRIVNCEKLDAIEYLSERRTSLSSVKRNRGEWSALVSDYKKAITTAPVFTPDNRKVADLTVDELLSILERYKK